MKDGNVKELVVKSFWASILETFDAGKAIVAALAVGVLGYLANLLTSLYGFVYWNGYFECFNLPLQYFEDAIDTVSNFYGFVVAVPICVVYLLLQLKYNSCIKGALVRKHHGLACWFMRSSTYIVLPVVYLMFAGGLLIVLNGGNDFIMSFVISSSAMNTVISILLGGRNIYKRKSELQDSSPKYTRSFWKATVIIGITVFVLSLYFTYLLGYFQKVILVDIPQVITVDGEDTTQQYGKLLETDGNYICAPISFEEGKEYIMHIQNRSYRVIPKDEIVTITESKAWALYRDKGAGVLFDFIGYNEDAFVKLFCCSIAFSVVLLYIEYLLFLKKLSKGEKTGG